MQKDPFDNDKVIGPDLERLSNVAFNILELRCPMSWKWGPAINKDQQKQALWWKCFSIPLKNFVDAFSSWRTTPGAPELSQQIDLN